MTSTLASIADRVLEWVAPTRCAACREPAHPGSAFCARCELAIGCPVVGTLDALPLHAAAHYAGPVARAVKRLKYDDHPDLARPLGRFMASRLSAVLPAADRVVPVPLHPHRLAERFYNQSALLAKELARHLHMRADPRSLQRVRLTAQQARLTQRERHENVRAAFQSRPFSSKTRVLVVDDVVTTGATALACTAALEAAGARVVAVVALAWATPA